MSPRNAERDADTEFCFTRMLVITNFRFYVVVLVVARSDLSKNTDSEHAAIFRLPTERVN